MLSSSFQTLELFKLTVFPPHEHYQLEALLILARLVNITQFTFVLQVSWIRLKDLNILTLSTFRYSTNRRVSIRHDPQSSQWMLRIARVTQQDASAYECQISTKPVLSFIVNLEVIGECILIK